MRNRIESLDYLRGTLALSVLLYHFATWDQWRVGAFGHDVLQRLGIYAVCSFYVISGVSFGYVYRDLPLRLPEIRSFWIKRYFRLAPLYWAALLFIVARALLVGVGLPSPGDLLLNATLLFGLLSPTASAVTGGWSIGNEMAFYLFFPFAALALRRGRRAFGFLLAVSVVVGAWYAFGFLSPDRPLADQWGTYINPLNHAFLFICGVGVSAWIASSPRIPAKASAAAVALLVVVFCLLPVGRDSISLVTGWTRVLYSAVCVGVCTVAALGVLPVPGMLRRPLQALGDASYSVYLLHPIVYAVTSMGLEVLSLSIPPSVVALPVALVGSCLVYHLFEAPMVELGRRVAGASRRSAPVPAVDTVAP